MTGVLSKLGLHNPLLGFTNFSEWLTEFKKAIIHNYQLVTKGTSQKKTKGKDDRVLGRGRKHSPYIYLPVFTSPETTFQRLLQRMGLHHVGFTSHE